MPLGITSSWWIISPRPSSGKGGGGGTQLSLEKVDLKNVSFTKRDAWLGQDMTIAVGSLNLTQGI